MSMEDSYVLADSLVSTPSNTTPGPPQSDSCLNNIHSQILASAAVRDRRAEIIEAVEAHDVPALRILAGEPGGFMTTSLRQRVWCVDNSYSLHGSLTRQAIQANPAQC